MASEPNAYLSSRAKKTYANRDWFAERLREGLRPEGIAERTGMSVHTIGAWKMRHGLSTTFPMTRFPTARRRRHPTRPAYANRDWLAARLAEGLSTPAIAKKCRVVNNTIHAWKRHFKLVDLAASKRSLSPLAQATYANRDWFAAALASGGTREDLAEWTDASIATIVFWARYHGLSDQLGWRVKKSKRDYLGSRAKATYAKRSWMLVRLRTGEPYRKIAREAGMSVACFMLWLRRHGLTDGSGRSLHARETYANETWLRTQFAKGASDEEMAQAAGITAGAIQRWRLRFNISRPRMPRRPCQGDERRAFGAWLASRLPRLPLARREKKILRAYFGIGADLQTYQQIGEAVGVSRERIRQLIARSLRCIVRVSGSRRHAYLSEVRP